MGDWLKGLFSTSQTARTGSGLSGMFGSSDPTSAVYTNEMDKASDAATAAKKPSWGMTEAEKKQMAMKLLSQGLQSAGQQGQMSVAPQVRSQPQLIGGGQMINPQGR